VVPRYSPILRPCRHPCWIINSFVVSSNRVDTSINRSLFYARYNDDHEQSSGEERRWDGIVGIKAGATRVGWVK
jgi:hypothetical protein